MTENKTQPTAVKVSDFLATIDHPVRKADAVTIDAMMQTATGGRGTMWGTSIVGYGYTVGGPSAPAGTPWFDIGFSPRKANLVLYGMGDADPGLLASLGKHKLGKGCLYINKLSDVDVAVLQRLIDIKVANAHAERVE
jgi:hypothetical protein